MKVNEIRIETILMTRVTPQTKIVAFRHEKKKELEIESLCTSKSASFVPLYSYHLSLPVFA